MQTLDVRTHWPRDFLATLELAGLASARLPFGVPDPVLRGAAAVALYTGGLWPAASLEIATVDEAKLVAELFAIGFRWSRGLRHADLLHPACEVGIEILSEGEVGTSAEQENRLSVALDLERTSLSEVTMLKVVGIEDLIAEQVRYWLLDGAPSGEQVAMLQALVALARAGVGGPLRANYLQRRLALETKGQVFIDDLRFEAGRSQVGTPRSIGLTEMQTRIQVWRAREGLPSDPQGAIGRDSSGAVLTGTISGHHNGPAEGRQSGFESATILPFHSSRAILPFQR
jgi:hypothetical protein